MDAVSDLRTHTAMPVCWPLDQKSVVDNQEAQNAIQKVLQIERQAAELKTHLNMLLPAGRIPDDIWVAVFWEVISEAHHPANPEKYSLLHKEPVNGPYPLWIHLAYVCRRWKRLVYNTPALWSLVDWTINPSCMRVALSRLKQHSISILRVRFGGEYRRKASKRLLKETVSEALHEMRRAHHVIVHLRNDYVHNPSCIPALVFIRTLDSTFRAPHLRSLHLSHLTFPSEVEPDAKLPFSDPAMFPRLRELHIGPRTSPLFLSTLSHPTLTSLTVDISDEMITEAMLFGVLQELPLLEDLALRRYLLSEDEEGEILPMPSWSIPHITLTKLRRLHITDVFTRCPFILQHLTIPKACDVWIRLGDFFSHSDKAPIESIVQWLKESGTTSEDGGLTAVDVAYSDDDPIHSRDSASRTDIRSWAQPPGDENLDDDVFLSCSEHKFRIELSVRRGHFVVVSYSSDLLAKTLAMLHVEDTKTLTLIAPPLLDNLFIAELVRMKAVESLRVYASNLTTEYLLTLLASETLDVRQGSRKTRRLHKLSLPSPQDVLLPNLSHIILENDSSDGTVELWKGGLLPRIYRTLETCQKEGRPIANLVFRGASPAGLSAEDVCSGFCDLAVHISVDFKARTLPTRFVSRGEDNAYDSQEVYNSQSDDDEA